MMSMWIIVKRPHIIKLKLLLLLYYCIIYVYIKKSILYSFDEKKSKILLIFILLNILNKNRNGLLCY